MADARTGMTPFISPVDLVDAVTRLLHDVIAAEPPEVPPVAQLPFHIRPAVAPWMDAEGARVIGRVHADDAADGAVVDPLVGRPLREAVPPAEAGHEVEPLLSCVLGGLDHLAHACGVNGHRFLTEDVPPCFDGGSQVRGPEVRRRGQDDHVHVAFNDPAVRVEPGELCVGGHANSLRCMGLEAPEACGQLVLEHVTHRHKDDTWVGVEGLRARTGPAAAAPDQPDANRIRSGCVDERCAQSTDGRSHRRGPDELAACHRCVSGAGLIRHGLPPFTRAGSQMTRKPTKPASASHQMLRGIWGSLRFQSTEDATPATHPIPSSSSR